MKDENLCGNSLGLKYFMHISFIDDGVDGGENLGVGCFSKAIVLIFCKLCVIVDS